MYFSPRIAFRCSLLLRVFGGALATALISGCSGSAPQSPGSKLSGNTTVTILSTSTANDKFFQFSATIETLTLTSQSGKTVSLLTTPLNPEFMHLNGTAEPLATVSVPQDVYVSAAATLGPTGFTCATVGSNGTILTHAFVYDPVPASDVTVSLPAPITIAGASMALSLDLLVSQSGSYASCYASGADPFTLTPTFSMTPMAVSAQPASSGDGRLNGLEGIVAQVNSSGSNLSVDSVELFNDGGVDPASGPTWQITSNGSTVFQGIAGPSQLASGMAVDIDAALQRDGTLLATRIAVYDADATEVSLWSVPMLRMNTYGPQANVGAREGIGPLLVGDNSPIDFSNSTFNISGQLTNLSKLPFSVSFTGANMVAGQNIEPTFHLPGDFYPGDYGFPATTVTLVPQTINGTVSAIGGEGGFTTYTITLAPYDLFPALAVQQDQTTLLTDPSTVVVYADDSTQMLNTSPVAVSGVVRFYGLVFNDNGTLRMDCAQINDGVTE
jgi:hypothetical protein